MNRIRTILEVLGIALAVAACDPIYGVSRVQMLDKLPSAECIEQAVLSIDGVSELNARKEEGGKPLTWARHTRA